MPGPGQHGTSTAEREPKTTTADLAEQLFKELEGTIRHQEFY